MYQRQYFVDKDDEKNERDLESLNNIQIQSFILMILGRFEE